MSAGLLAFVTVLLNLAGCTCSHQGLEGAADITSDEDAPLDIIDIWDSDSGEAGDASGDELDDDDVIACPDHDGDGHSDIACGGDDCDDTDPEIYPGAEEVCADGVDQDCDGIVDGLTTVWTSEKLEDSTGGGQSAFLFWTGSEYLLGWKVATYSPWYIDRISASGDVIEHNRILPGVSRQTSMHAAYTGSSVGLTWIQISTRIMFSFITADGTGLLDPVAVVEDEGLRDHQTMVWTGSAMHIAWKYMNEGVADLVVTSVDETGASTAADLWLSTGRILNNVPPSIAWTGSTLGVVWSSFEDYGLWEWDNYEVLLKMIDPGAGTIGDLVNISYHEGSSDHPHVQWTGSELTTVWRDDRFSGSDVFFVRTGDTGISLIDEVRLEGAGIGIFEPIRHVWTGSEFIVGWNEYLYGYKEIVLHRLDPRGVPLGELVRTESVEWSASLTDMVWTGSEIGIIKRDGMYENEGLYFTRIGYCE